MRRKLLLVLFSLAVPALVAELFLRARGYAPLEKLRGTVLWQFLRMSEDPVQVYELVPGAQGTCFGAEVTVNSRGFRDAEYVVPKPPGVRRIVVLGDSITFGYDLALEDTFPERLEARFAAEGRPIEVCNLGVTGYDTLQETRMLERVGMALEPDLILVGHCFNDAGMASVELAQFEGARRYTGLLSVTRVGQWFAERWQKHVAVRSYHERNEEQRYLLENRPWIADLTGDPRLQRRMQMVAQSIETSQNKPPAWSPLWWYSSPAHMGKLRHAFDELKRIAGDVPVVVVVLPFLKERPCIGGYDTAYTILESEAKDHGFRSLRLAEPVRAAGPRTFQVRPTDWIHFNAAGHALLEEHIARYLEGSGLLDGTQAESRDETLAPGHSDAAR